MAGYTDIAPLEFKAWRDAGMPHVLLDVREPDEWATAALSGSIDIPMGQVLRQMATLPNDRPIVVMCHHGARSARVAGVLAAHGFTGVRNLDGGIEAYAREADPAVPRY